MAACNARLLDRQGGELYNESIFQVLRQILIPFAVFAAGGMEILAGGAG